MNGRDREMSYSRMGWNVWNHLLKEILIQRNWKCFEISGKDSKFEVFMNDSDWPSLMQERASEIESVKLKL